MRVFAFAVAFSLLMPLAAWAQTKGDVAPPFQTNQEIILNMREMNSGEQHEAFKIFDNLYYVGVNFVSAYLMPTSEGLILIDATFDWSVGHVLKGIRDMGFDPKDIKYILITHWHTDHYDGCHEIQKLSGATVGMVPGDWDDLPVKTKVPKKKRMVIADGDTLTLGDATLKFYHSPGHTKGVLSIEYTLYDGDEAYKGFTHGGTGLNFSGVDSAENYVASARRVLAMEGIEVNVPNHEFMGDVFKRAENLAERKPGEPHPFVAPDDFTRFIEGLLASGEKKLADERERAEKRHQRRNR